MLAPSNTDPENGGAGAGFINPAPPHCIEPVPRVIGTCAIGVIAMFGWQIAGIVGVLVMVGVGVMVGVSVAVPPAGVWVAAGVQEGSGVGAPPPPVQASQQLGHVDVTAWPPLGA